ncbi:MAG TPA: S-adenosylmethionine:tRNA ribosyltransferase-isomerase, partial [Myxococcota bacterium]|nr:S-adenosylmethionine:tRNA ribosyltransferase-isomerase [Myxococcota bacterium]
MNLYDFALPPELIATKPSPDRSASRLMVLENSASLVKHDYFKNLGHYLKSGDVLVVNNTKVRRARIYAFKKTGGRVELLLVKPLPNGHWEALIVGKGPFLPKTELSLDQSDEMAKIVIEGKASTDANVYEISSVNNLGSYAEDVGELPLPPYFNRRAEPDDYSRYQTIFAKELGAVAAPT